MGLFTSDDEIVRVGALYLKIVGPIYGFYGLGMALYFANPRFRKRHLDRDCQRRPPTHKHWMCTGRHLLARSRYDRILCRNRRCILRICGTDICRDIQGEGAHTPLRVVATIERDNAIYTERLPVAQERLSKH